MKKSVGKTITKILLGGCASIGLLLLTSWLMSTKHVTIHQSSTVQIQATIPYLSEIPELLFCTYSKAFCDFSIKTLNSLSVSITSNDVTSQVNFYTGMFYRPLFFFYSEEKEAVFVIYSADLQVEYLAIRIHGESGISFPDNHSPWWIVSIDQSLSIKEMTKAELNGMLSMLEDMPEGDIRKFSVPTFDIGFYKYYMPKQSIIEIIAKKLEN
jgi:hypothetical protein